MRILTVVLILFLILAPVSTANTLERDSEIDMKGQIDSLSTVTAGETETVVKVEGHGGLVGSESVTVDEEDLSFNMAYSLEADDAITVTGRPYRSLEVLTGVKVAADNLYVTNIEATGGHRAEIYKTIGVELGTINLALDKQAMMTGGVYQRHIELSKGDVSLNEVMKVVGYGEAKDRIRFD